MVLSIFSPLRVLSRTRTLGGRPVRPRPATQLNLEQLESRVLLESTGFTVTSIQGGIDPVAYAATLDASSKILVAGMTYEDNHNFGGVFRYTPNGILDSSFGRGGVAIATNSPHVFPMFNSILSYPPSQSNKILAAGVTENFDIVLARFTLSGSPDTTWKSRYPGTLVTDLGGGYDRMASLLLQGDGKIIALGTEDYFSGNQLTLVRYNSTGKIDTTFGRRGFVQTSFGTTYTRAEDSTWQGNKILVAGSIWLPDLEVGQMLLVRYNNNGSLDTSFGTGGWVSSNIMGWATDVSVDPVSGNIIVAGDVAGSVGVARFTPTGVLDTSFGTNGGVALNMETERDYNFNGALGLQPDGKIVVGGTHTFVPSGGEFVVARLNNNGTLDTTFGAGTGYTATTITINGVVLEPWGSSIVLQPDPNPNNPTKIVQVGAATGGPLGWDIVLIRYNADGSLDTTFGGSPLQAAAPGSQVTTPLSLTQVQPLLGEAVRRWALAGIDVAPLWNIRLGIRDLGGVTLGLAGDHTLWLDDNAAGWGWFVDPTPGNDAELTTTAHQGEQNRIDLLSVLMHEMGHLLGQNHEATGLMAETLAAGTRLAPLNTLDHYFAAANPWTDIAQLLAQEDARRRR